MTAVTFTGWVGDRGVSLDCACGWSGTVQWDVSACVTAACPYCGSTVILEADAAEVAAARRFAADDTPSDVAPPSDVFTPDSRLVDGFDSDHWRARLLDAGWRRAPAEWERD